MQKNGKPPNFIIVIQLIPRDTEPATIRITNFSGTATTEADMKIEDPDYLFLSSHW